MNIDTPIEDLIPIVAMLSEKYTSKLSTSITYEMANQLMEAVKYCIREREYQLKEECGSKNEIVSSKESAMEAYQRGYDIVVKKVKEVQRIYDALAIEFKAYGNQNLQDTVMRGIPGFLLHYDARFYPQNHILTMDYPVIGQQKLQGICGVDVILTYLRCIEMEQTFLAPFPKAYVIEILNQYHSEYEKMFLNLCEVLLVHLLCCLLIGKPMVETCWRKEEYQRLEHDIITNTTEELRKELEEILVHFLESNYSASPFMVEYFSQIMDELLVNLTHVARHHCVERLFHQD